jgi:hypothetical protein
LVIDADMVDLARKTLLDLGYRVSAQRLGT